MMKKTLIIFLFFVAATASFAQEINYAKIKSEFDTFQYESMIKSSDALLAKGILSDSLTVDVYVMRAVAFYQMGNDVATRQSFENILKLRRNFNPDPSQVSPKLILLFGEIKADFLKNNPLPISEADTSRQITHVKLFGQERMKGFILENLLVPGIAQLQLGKNPKGILLSAASVLNLGAAVYFIIDTKNKENEYLKQSDKQEILNKYSAYNNAYKTRNALLISYALLWVYGQLDLLLFSDEKPGAETSSSVGSVQLHRDLFSDYIVSFKITF
jgi:hypothetical protein